MEASLTMKTALVNLPLKKRIVRRYTCSYYAVNSLFPPLELMSLAAIVRDWKKDETVVIDCIAQKLGLEQLIARLKDLQPDMLVAMTAIEMFSGDIDCLEQIKKFFPNIKIICFGYLPTQFPKEILTGAGCIDFIIMGEPEEIFSQLYDRIKNGEGVNDLSGIAARIGREIFVGPARERIKDLDALPFPARDLVDGRLYNEFFSPRPFVTILSSRGCPMTCSFCVRTFGQRVVYRSIENTLKEIEEVILKYRVKTVRFMDDNFCVDAGRVKEFCETVIRRNLKFQWSALARTDNLSEALLRLMKQAGCFRLYLGVETFSPKLLKVYQKNTDSMRALEVFGIMRRLGIESVGFFMVGGVQSEAEFKEDVRIAAYSDLDYAVIEKLTPYPGTPFFEQMKEEIDFDIFPYKNRLKDTDREKKILQREKEFYRRFYLKPRRILRMLRNIVLYPGDACVGLKDFLMFSGKNPNRDEPRSDLI